MTERNRATGEAMVRIFLVTVCMSCALWLALAGAATARVSCADWNTKAFFENAAAVDVSRCLSAGADLEARDALGRTPLHVAAAFSETPSVIAALLDAGADPGARDALGRTPLHVAAAIQRNPFGDSGAAGRRSRPGGAG